MDNFSFKNILRGIISRVLWLPIDLIAWVFISPFLIFFMGPILIYRSCVILYARFLYPLHTIAPPESHISGSDLFYAYKHGKPSEFSAGSFTMVLGDISVEKLRSHWKHTIVDARNEDGILKYPQLSSTPTLIGGYLFLKPIVNFTLDNIYKVNLKNNQSVEEFKQMFKNKSYNPDLPLWEVAVVKQNEESLVCTRFHHSIADGYSIIYLRNLLCGKNMADIERNTNDSHQEETEGYFLRAYNLLQSPRKVVELGLSLISTRNCIRTTRRGSDVPVFGFTTLYYSDLKTIVRKTGTSFNALNLYLLTSVLRRIIPNDVSGDYIYVGTTVPLPNHPTKSGKIGNHFGPAAYRIPIKEMEPVRRLLECHESIVDFNRKGLYFGQMNFLKLVSYLPINLICRIQITSEKLVNIKLMSANMLTWEEGGNTLLGHPVIEEFQLTSRCSYNIAFGQSSIIEGDTNVIALVVPSNIADSGHKMSEFMAYYTQELNNLLTSIKYVENV